jgi:Family of unknown function (DUF6241)
LGGGRFLGWIKEHKLLVIIVSVIAICVGVILVNMIDKKAVSSSETVSKEENTTATSQPISTKEEVNLSENPFENSNSNSNLSEKEILNYMHGMSHQKVVAEEKWIHYEMTSERIQYLINAIELGNYNNEELFLDILHRWADGDFKKADKDHNKIWNLQGGNVGEATGVMTPKEEQQYLEDFKGNIQ